MTIQFKGTDGLNQPTPELGICRRRTNQHRDREAGELARVEALLQPVNVRK